MHHRRQANEIALMTTDKTTSLITRLLLPLISLSPIKSRGMPSTSSNGRRSNKHCRFPHGCRRKICVRAQKESLPLGVGERYKFTVSCATTDPRCNRGRGKECCCYCPVAKTQCLINSSLSLSLFKMPSLSVPSLAYFLKTFLEPQK